MLHVVHLKSEISGAYWTDFVRIIMKWTKNVLSKNKQI